MNDRKDKARKVYGFYWNRLRKYPRYAVGIVLILPLAILVGGYLPPLILATVINRLSLHHYIAGQFWPDFGWLIIGYIALMLASLALWRTVDWFMWRLEANIQRDIAETVLAHMLNESTDFHANHFTGSLVSQTNKLSGSYVRAADTTVFQVYPMLLGIIFTVLILLTKAPLYDLFLLIFAIVFIAVAFRVSRPAQRVSSQYATVESRQTGYLADAITNVIAIKSFARGDFERKRFHGATNKTFETLMNFSRVQRRQMNSLGMVSRTMGSLALAVAVVSVTNFHANIGTVFLIFSYTSSITEQLFNFGNNSLRNYNRVVGDATDMVNHLANQPAVQDPVSPEPSRIKKGEVQFKDVDFTHEKDETEALSTKPLFTNFKLHIEPGERIGLVGHSGGGKTTLTKLILRFMDIDGGEILIDGQNIAKITQDDLRRAITYVPQEPLLFHRSLAENIAYGKPRASKADIEQAAKLAHAHEFIKDLPNGYDTLVGERGIKLSGGQRQRIAIARAMLKDAPILVLDEATSALDSESEKLIQDALWKLMEGKTTIVIAHRLSTIQRMDRILVLDEGQIVEEGTHQELRDKKSGVYAKLWAHQSGGFLKD